MTIQQLRAAYKATPFRPFTLHMADGRSFPVPHPDFLSMSPTGQRSSSTKRAKNSASWTFYS